MNKKLRKFKKNWITNLLPTFRLHGPPYGMCNVFPVWDWYAIYHKNVEATMKRSYYWIQSEFEQYGKSKGKEKKDIQASLPSIKSYMKNGMLSVEIGDQYKEPMDLLATITPKIEKGMLKIEIGNEQNKKLVSIDFKGVEFLKIEKVQT